MRARRERLRSVLRVSRRVLVKVTSLPRFVGVSNRTSYAPTSAVSGAMRVTVAQHSRRINSGADRKLVAGSRSRSASTVRSRFAVMAARLSRSLFRRARSNCHRAFDRKVPGVECIFMCVCECVCDAISCYRRENEDSSTKSMGLIQSEITGDVTDRLSRGNMVSERIIFA